MLRTVLDLFFGLLIILIMIFPWGEHAGLLARLALILCACGMPVFLLQWHKRIPQHFKRRNLMRLPFKTVCGVLSEPLPYNTGETRSVAVPTGFTQKYGGDWGTYVHYRYESHTVYSGQYAELLCGDTPMVFRSLPPYFFSKEDSIPVTMGIVKITYVTDTDGTNYFISARPVEKA